MEGTARPIEESLRWASLFQASQGPPNTHMGQPTDQGPRHLGVDTLSDPCSMAHRSLQNTQSLECGSTTPYLPALGSEGGMGSRNRHHC